VTDRRRIILYFLFVVGLALATLWAHSTGLLKLETIQSQASSLRRQVQNAPVTSSSVFVTVFIALTLALPVAALLTLLAGFLFGPLLATLFAVAAMTVSALIGFTISRHLAGNWVQHRYRDRLQAFNAEIESRGPIYLLVVRIVPVMPFAAVNLIAGLTRTRFPTFAWTTIAGSFPGTAIFSYAGCRLLAIDSLQDVWTPGTILAALLLVLLVALGTAAALLLKRHRS
jgi:uncharacterized membrane protein YdjX (TVP38/TMEM64 family)